MTKDSSSQCSRRGNLPVFVIPHVKIVTGITPDNIMPEHNQISRKFTYFLECLYPIQTQNKKRFSITSYLIILPM